MQGTRHGASGQRASQKTLNGRSKKQTHLSGIPLGALAAAVAAFYRELTQLLQEPEVEFLWGDETTVYDDWIRHRARAPVGLPVENFSHPRTQPRKQTLIAAMSAKKVFAPWCFEGSLESEKMLQWLQQLRPQLHENHVLILDNARPHHARKVREYLADHPIRILFFATIFSTHESDRKTVGGDQATVATTTSSGTFSHSKLRSKPTYSKLWRRAEKRLWPVVAIDQF